VASNITPVALYSLRAYRTENSVLLLQRVCRCIATFAALTAANSLLRCLLPSNEQQTLVLLLLRACFEVSPLQQLPHGANTPQYISSLKHDEVPDLHFTLRSKRILIEFSKKHLGSINGNKVQ
jgi:hypothetical protein